MKYFLLLLCIVLAKPELKAQAKDSVRPLQVGDTVVIGTCPGKSFKFIQYYKKTLVPNPAATYNKETGEDFYEYFFLDGEYDVMMLPCSYAGGRYRVLSMRVFADKNTGADRNVVFLDIGLNTVAWVEFDGAVANWEIYVE